MKRCVIVLSMVVAFAGAASASVQQGDTELNLSGNWSTLNGGDFAMDMDSLAVALGIGYFLTDTIQVEGVAMGTWIDNDGIVVGADEIGETTAILAVEGDVDMWAIGGKFKYHFMPTNQLVPYVGVLAMWADLDADGTGVALDDDFETIGEVEWEIDADGFIWGPVVGARYELNENNDFFIEYQYKMFEEDLGDFFDDSHQIWFGITHQFK